MKPILNKVLDILSWVMLIAYIVWASRTCTQQERDKMVTGVQVSVLDSAVSNIITPAAVRGWFVAEDMNLRNRAKQSLNVAEIEKIVCSKRFVKQAKVYTDISGVVHVELTQRMPIARVNLINGYNFYITDDLYILPMQGSSVLYVPIITGNFTPPFEKGYKGSLEELIEDKKKKLPENYTFLCKLIKFVKFIRHNDFWNAQIEQINVVQGGIGTVYGIDQQPQLEIVPRVGRHLVLMGPPDNFESKLDKLMKFYNDAIEFDGWDAYRYINLKFENQIVCTK